MTQTTLYRQCILTSGSETLISWLEATVKVGWKVTLADSDDPTQWWKVVNVSQFTLAKAAIKDAHTSKNWYKKDFHGRLTGLKIET